MSSSLPPLVRLIRRHAGAVCLLAMTAAVLPVGAAQPGAAPGAAAPVSSRHESMAIERVNEAVTVTRQMELEPRLKPFLQQAKAIFIIPSYVRAAVGVGGRGGGGILLVKNRDGSWTDPAFYNIGGLTVGLQAGIEGGPMAFILNNDKAISRFRQRNNFSLNAAAGITILDWSKIAEGSTGAGDAVAWSGTRGLFADVASIGINDIHFNLRLNQAYYHTSKAMSVADMLNGTASNTHAEALKEQMVAISGGSTSVGR